MDFNFTWGPGGVYRMDGAFGQLCLLAPKQGLGLVALSQNSKTKHLLELAHRHLLSGKSKEKETILENSSLKTRGEKRFPKKLLLRRKSAGDRLRFFFRAGAGDAPVRRRFPKRALLQGGSLDGRPLPLCVGSGMGRAAPRRLSPDYGAGPPGAGGALSGNALYG